MRGERRSRAEHEVLLGTGIAMQRAEAIAALVTEAEFRAELRFIEWLSRGEVSA